MKGRCLIQKKYELLNGRLSDTEGSASLTAEGYDSFRYLGS